MKLLRRRSPLLTSLFISCFFIAVVIQPTQAKQVTAIPSVQELNRTARTVKEWFAQIEQQNPPVQNQVSEVVQVTSVKVNPTSLGVEVILQTSLGRQLQVVNRSSGNNFIANIPNAQLRLPSGEAFTFRSTKPIAGVGEITVTNFDATTIRVSVTGETGIPQVELFDSPNEGIIFSVATAASIAQQRPQTQPKPQQQPESQTQPSQSSAQGDEPIELVVTGEQDGYSVPDATTATKIDTPLRDIPQSIQVIPQTVIKDQGITRIVDAVRNVSGAVFQSGYGNVTGDITLRGFGSTTNLRDGFINGNSFPIISGDQIEQVEVLKGPASVLYGQASPGGVVNYVTKKPLSEPHYSADFTVGSYDYYKPTLDLSGPLTQDKKLLYRLIVSNENSRSYRDFIDNRIFFISPSFTYKISDATTLNFAYEYLDAKIGFDRGFPPFSAYFNLSRNRNLGEPFDYQIIQTHLVEVTLDHKFSENLRLKSGFTGRFDYEDGAFANFYEDVGEDGRTLRREAASGVNIRDNFALQTDLIGKFKTGSVAHQLLFGFELRRETSQAAGYFYNGEFPSIDIFNPTYGLAHLNLFALDNGFNGPASILSTQAIYLQDQVTLLPNLKLLIGGRYDFIKNGNQEIDSLFYDEAFSPRVGIVYQPIEPISIYASYSQSFQPNNAQTANKQFIDPSRGTQYEVGVKAELFDQRLSATLAAYDLAQTNLPVQDPQNPDYSIPIGAAKSRGIELDVAGEILPGWKVIASGYLNDTHITDDSDATLIGRRFVNAPYHGASLWTTYQIQRGNLQGLQFGAGFFFVGDRTANPSDPITLPSYVRTDASISYKRDNWQAALNLKNIFNINYYETNGYLFYPQAPFTVQGTLSVNF
ncbi:TonB-dependent siderophore receptor [Nostoc sp.]|uniref:TonB-dependent siderophore receptor n=1 Tax=Nostoc sp. TaxID=1180 RepID=UPI002FF5845B